MKQLFPPLFHSLTTSPEQWQCYFLSLLSHDLLSDSFPFLFPLSESLIYIFVHTYSFCGLLLHPIHFITDHTMHNNTWFTDMTSTHKWLKDKGLKESKRERLPFLRIQFYIFNMVILVVVYQKLSEETGSHTWTNVIILCLFLLTQRYMI